MTGRPGAMAESGRWIPARPEVNDREGTISSLTNSIGPLEAEAGATAAIVDDEEEDEELGEAAEKDAMDVED